jgi:serine/threonine-protein kinase
MSDMIASLNATLAGRYEVERELGQGGMATVYLAKDVKHGRRVALKLLKPELAAVVGAERFLAEIQTTASLQNPHILPLFDSGQAGTYLYYVMPFVEGETLRDRIDREKQLPVDEAVYIATAVAGALQHAHDRGVIHRDIKPANILLLDGEPLVADFGIALAVGAAGGNRLTETGLSVGTPFYMSPEQATGDVPVGPASDIYALGCVLYEMLIGEPPYPGSTAQAVLGKIIQGLPVSPAAIRRSVPPNVDAAVRRALEKLPADRFTGGQELAKALADRTFRHGEPAGALASASGTRWKRVAIGSGVVSAGLAAGLAWLLLAPAAPASVERFSLLPVPGQLPDYDFTISDDGSMVVFERVESGTSHLALRRLGSLEASAISGTEGAANPEISPDGTELAFVANAEIRVTPLQGGVTRTVADSVFCCIRWGPDDFIYFSALDRTIKRVPAEGGDAEPVTTRQEAGDGPHGDFQVVPGSDMAVFTVWGSPYRVEVMRVSTGERRALTEGLKPFVTRDGDLVFGTLDGRILAAPLDPEALALAGPAVPLVDGVRVDGDDWPYYALAPNGTLGYWTGLAGGASTARLVWVSRDGVVTAVDSTWQFNPGATENAVALSPDGRRAALKIVTEAGEDIWVKQLDAGPLSRLTFDPGLDRRPRWSRDGRFIIYTSGRVGGVTSDHFDLWRQPSDGTGAPELLLDREESILEVDRPPDESMFVLRLGGAAGVTGIRDLVGLRVGDSITIPLAAEPYDEKAAALSPDGRWLAYESTETGRDEIYVRPFPNVNGGKWQVSAQGGINPRWSGRGGELFYIDGTGRMIVATYAASAGFEVRERRSLFSATELNVSAGPNYTSWDVAGDGSRFLMIQAGGGGDEDVANEFVLVQNWLTEVRERLGR